MRTTFSRAFFPAAIVLLVALLIVGIALQLLVGNFLTNQAIEGLKSDARAISALASAYHSEGSLSGRDFLVNLSVASQISEADSAIFDASGKLILCSHNPLGCQHQGLYINPEYARKVLLEGTVVDRQVFQGLYEEERFLVSVCIPGSGGEAVGFVMVSAPSDSFSHILNRILDFYLMLSLLVVAAAVVIMSLFARSQSAPLKELSKAASAFGHGDLTARVKISDDFTTEIEEVAIAFNNMAASLEKADIQRREFVANVSHELKTPMTTIGGYIDGILDGTIPPQHREHYMQIVSGEIKRLSRLVRSMLDISRMQEQGGIPESQKTRFDICECAGQVLITFEQKITGKELDVEVELPEHPLYTRANRDAITQVIYNLLDNSVKFCPQGGQISLRITESGSKLYVAVANTGETIPPEELPLLFDRFHKLDKSRSQNRDGWGLGLYIVKTLVCSHNENISVTSRNGKTEFIFTLPLVP